MHIQKMTVIYDSIEELRSEDPKATAGYRCVYAKGYIDGHVKIEYEKEDDGKKGGPA